jgi:hypothetical protein
MSELEKPPQKHGENKENSSLGSGGSRTRPGCMRSNKNKAEIIVFKPAAVETKSGMKTLFASANIEEQP